MTVASINLWTAVVRFATVLRLLYWNADTTTFRLIFAISSLFLGVFMFLHETAFLSPGMRLMGEVLPASVWACMFIAHWAFVTWRFLDPTPRVYCSLAINCFGFSIWLAYVVLQDISLGYFAINSSAERVLVIFSFWTIVRTGTRQEVVSP